MTRVYIADARPDERTALRLLLDDLKMEVVGQAANWFTTLTQVPASHTDMVLVDWDILPSTPSIAVGELRQAGSPPLGLTDRNTQVGMVT